MRTSKTGPENNVLALLSVALRWDLPTKIDGFSDEVSVCLAEGYLAVCAADYLRISDAGIQYVGQMCGPYYAKKLNYFGPGHWFLDNVYFCPAEAELTTAEVYSLIRRDLSAAAAVVNEAMCAMGEQYRNSRKCWHTLKGLRDSGRYYNVSAKNDHEVAWRFLWREQEERPLGLCRRWMGIKANNK